MTGLSRCGRKYPTFESALLAAELRTSMGARPLAVVSCDLGEHWHLASPASATGHAYIRPDPFPPPVRLLLARRDECCQRCGKTGRLEAHHRRAKASGGSSARSHTQCACNGVLLCRGCHEWVHLNPRKARAEGWIVLQSVSKPAAVPIVADPATDADPDVDTDTRPWYPTCDGGWNDQP